MPTYYITTRDTHLRTFAIEAETTEEALRAYLEEGAGDEVDVETLETERLGEPTTIKPDLSAFT